MPAADALVSTDAERASLDALRAAAGEEDGQLERHGVRLFRLASALAPSGDREVLLVAALLHDAGVLDAVRGPGPYVTDGRVWAEGILQPFGWEPERLRLCLDAIEFHHEMRRQDARGAEVEAIRKGDLVDVSAGLVRFGLPREVVRSAADGAPRRGFARALAGIVGGLVVHQPGTLLRIFRPRA
jgi:hypothetical protein